MKMLAARSPLGRRPRLIHSGVARNLRQGVCKVAPPWYDSSLRGHARMKLQTCRDDLSYTNAPYCAQQLPRFLIFIEKINFKIKPSRYDFDRIIANVNTPKNEYVVADQ